MRWFDGWSVVFSLGLVAALACAGCPAGDDDDDSAVGDDDDTTEEGPMPAELVELSDGECPDLSESGSSTFSSGGAQRRVTVVVPDEPADGMPALFFFHGLLSPDYTPQPTDYMAEALDLQDWADETGSVIVLPESRVMNELNMEFFMWEVMERDELDLVLYDDLRTCLVDQLGVDIRRIAATGFSGGSLFVTVLTRERGDTLAVVMENSGGSDVELPLYPPVAEYGTPTNDQLPVLLVSGGENDGWPEGGFTLVNFDTATDSYEASLVADGFYVVRCRHTFGHTIVSRALDIAKLWLYANAYGEPSPYQETGIDDWSDWCEVVE